MERSERSNRYCEITLNIQKYPQGMISAEGIQKRLYQQTSMGILLKSLKIAYMLLNQLWKKFFRKAGKRNTMITPI